ncbi:MAG TPA: MMPL family transporter [Gemmatimonadales bacterium]|nr:MMPL family transporter [Gemmatimonadales bacterium]
MVRWRWLVVAGWAVVGAVAVAVAPGTVHRLNIRGGSDRPTEAIVAERMVQERFDRPLGEFFAVVLEGPAPFDSAGRPAEVLAALASALRGEGYVSGVVTWREAGEEAFRSPDRRRTFFLASLGVPGPEAGAYVDAARATLRAALVRLPDGDRYRVWVTGRAPLDLDVRTVSAEDSRRGELRLLPLTLGILVLAFGALVAALLPVAVGMLAISVALALIGVITRFTPVSIFVLNMTTMIGLGVGIDYSLLVVTRFREEMKRGIRRTEAALRTMRTAGGAVITSGLTVMVGFAALLLTPMVETRSVGLGGLIVVATAILLCSTLLPALLAILGRHIDQPRALAKRLAWYHAPLMWEKWARTLHRHPRRALVLGGLAVAVLTAPLFLLRIGLPSRHWWPGAAEAGRGLELLQEMGAGGVILPLRVVVEVPEGQRAAGAARLRGLRRLSNTLAADPRVKQVRSLVTLRPGLSLLEYSLLYGDREKARADVGEFVDAYLSRDGRVTILDVIPADTASLGTTMELVRDLRTMADSGLRGLDSSGVLVGGYVAATVDFQEELWARFPLLVALILAATAVMLAVAFRSVLVPLKAIVMNSLSVAATFGLIVLVFQKGWGAAVFGLDGPTDAIFVVVPVLVFAVVFGLSMDYEVFLLSRIKEAYDRTGRNDEATMEGLSATASVITSAALIMILVFGAFAFARVLMVQFIGFGLAVAVLLDATLIRMVLVPAFMQLAGEWNWWPGESGGRTGGR